MPLNSIAGRNVAARARVVVGIIGEGADLSRKRTSRPPAVSVITDGMGLNITVMSLDGHLDVGIVADREQMPDVARLVGWLDDELAALMPPAPKARRQRSAKAEPAAS